LDEQPTIAAPDPEIDASVRPAVPTRFLDVPSLAPQQLADQELELLCREETQVRRLLEQLVADPRLAPDTSVGAIRRRAGLGR
jgi:hypothetical protein